MAPATTTAQGLARLGSLIADETRAEILCALMDGRAHTGGELARHTGVAPSTVSGHLGKLLDGGIVAVEPQGRHRYWRLADQSIAELLESLGAAATIPDGPMAPADLLEARTCYDHLAGRIAVEIYDRLLAADHLRLDGERLDLAPSGFELLASVGVDTEAIRGASRVAARPCLDWTQRRPHLAGAAGRELLTALVDNGWMTLGRRPRSIRVTEIGRVELPRAFGLTWG
ncbi:MAG: metalloregulator ArsR/SmtB family transcription factor [Actinomycetota bacterium]